MATAIFTRSRIGFIASLVTLFLCCYGPLQAQDAAPLPDYVVKEFGKPPTVPKGPLSKDLQSAVTVAFIDSMAQSTWGSDQTKALNVIAASKDPRLVWVISDLLRFTSGGEPDAALAGQHRNLVDLGKACLVTPNAMAADTHRDLAFTGFGVALDILRSRRENRHRRDKQGKQRRQQFVHFAKTIKRGLVFGECPPLYRPRPPILTPRFSR